MRITILLVPLVGLVVACGGGMGVPHRDMDRTLDKGDVIGRWVLTDDSLKAAKEKGLNPRAEPYTITFNRDMTVVYDSVASMIDGPTPIAAQGRWALLHGTTGDSNVVYRNLVRVELPSRRFHLQFDEQAGHLVLWEDLGDPDNGRFLEHERGP